MSENYNKIEEKLDNILEQLQEQQKINNSIIRSKFQLLLLKHNTITTTTPIR